MNVDQATDLVRESLTVMLVVSAPILIAALIIGLVISIIQAATQIQEQTLSFVPKILGMGVIAITVMPWIGKMIMEFAQRMFAGGA
ncbi:MAG: flagellar biosynthetic protein FliQ [Phycisphaeraceae bacterium]|nr:flagellar biosynthetic protein FliQ [Phycisphaeraceae bacterium]